MLLIGYFEGLDERAIAWRTADSFALSEFLGLVVPEAPAGPLDDFAGAGLVKGKTVGIDATTLEANAALRSIVRRDTGESYQPFLTKAGAGLGHRNADAGRSDADRS